MYGGGLVENLKPLKAFSINIWLGLKPLLVISVPVVGVHSESAECHQDVVVEFFFWPDQVEPRQEYIHDDELIWVTPESAYEPGVSQLLQASGEAPPPEHIR